MTMLTVLWDVLWLPADLPEKLALLLDCSAPRFWVHLATFMTVVNLFELGKIFKICNNYFWRTPLIVEGGKKSVKWKWRKKSQQGEVFVKFEGQSGVCQYRNLLAILSPFDWWHFPCYFGQWTWRSLMKYDIIPQKPQPNDSWCKKNCFEKNA